jgi:hypothetical protein
MLTKNSYLPKKQSVRITGQDPGNLCDMESVLFLYNKH